MDDFLDELEASRDDVADRTAPDDYDSALGKAIATWRQGRNIPLTLAQQLLEEGYDLQALEARHLR